MYTVLNVCLCVFIIIILILNISPERYNVTRWSGATTESHDETPDPLCFRTSNIVSVFLFFFFLALLHRREWNDITLKS